MSDKSNKLDKMMDILAIVNPLGAYRAMKKIVHIMETFLIDKGLEEDYENYLKTYLKTENPKLDAEFFNEILPEE